MYMEVWRFHKSCDIPSSYEEVQCVVQVKVIMAAEGKNVIERERERKRKREREREGERKSKIEALTRRNVL